MRFVSQSRGFSLQIVEPRVHFSQYGDRQVDREGYVAFFTQDGVIDHDVEFAEREFGGFPGRTTEVDEVTATPLLTRLSIYDTDEAAIEENWDPEFKELVEQKMLARSQNHPDFRRVTTLPIEAPWPAYMAYAGTLESLIEKIIEDGYDPARVLAFERQLDKPRPMVIAALETLIADQSELAQGAETVNA